LTVIGFYTTSEQNNLSCIDQGGNLPGRCRVRRILSRHMIFRPCAVFFFWFAAAVICSTTALGASSLKALDIIPTPKQIRIHEQLFPLIR